MLQSKKIAVWFRLNSCKGISYKFRPGNISHSRSLPDDYAHPLQIVAAELHPASRSGQQPAQLRFGVGAADRDYAVAPGYPAAKQRAAGQQQCQVKPAAQQVIDDQRHAGHAQGLANK